MTSLVIIARRWFNPRCGNTYFSAYALVDGKSSVSIPYAYGYGNHFEDETFDALERAGFCPGRKHYPNGAKETAWRYCERMGIAYAKEVSDVSRKKDL